MLTDAQKRFFKENGYLHLPQVFTPTEVESFRAGCRAAVPGDSMCRPDFHEIMFSPRIVDVIKDLIGDELIYPGLSLTRTRDYPKPFGGRFFHTDTVDDDYNFTQEYPILNTGIYLEDHTHYSNTLKVIPGSHRRRCITSKTITGAIKNIVRSVLGGRFGDIPLIVNMYRSVNIPTMPGDLLIWSVRTHHSGYGVRPRLFPNLSLPPIIENWIPAWMRLPDHPDRDVMLSIFAAPSPYFEKYLQKQIIKGYRHAHYLGNACLESPMIQEKAHALNITIRNDGYHYATTHAAPTTTAGEYD